MTLFIVTLVSRILERLNISLVCAQTFALEIGKYEFAILRLSLIPNELLIYCRLIILYGSILLGHVECGQIIKKTR